MIPTCLLYSGYFCCALVIVYQVFKAKIRPNSGVTMTSRSRLDTPRENEQSSSEKVNPYAQTFMTSQSLHPDITGPVDANKYRKNVVVAYCYLFFGGWFGAHHVYLGNHNMAFLYIWTCGIGGCGLLYDLFSLFFQVRSVNARNGVTYAEVDVKMRYVLVKVLFKYIPLALLAFFLSGAVLACSIPPFLNSMGTIDLYALRAGLDKNPYDVLEVPRFASAEETKVAFRTLSKKFHPDHNPDCADCAAKMAEINIAHEAVNKIGNPVSDVAQNWEALFKAAGDGMKQGKGKNEDFGGSWMASFREAATRMAQQNEPTTPRKGDEL